MATIVPAKLTGKENQLGSIEEGKIAKVIDLFNSKTRQLCEYDSQLNIDENLDPFKGECHSCNT